MRDWKAWLSAVLVFSLGVVAPAALAGERSANGVVESLAVDEVAARIISVGQGAEASARAVLPRQSEEAVVAAVVAAIESDIVASVASGRTSAELTAAVNKARNTPGISGTLAAALGRVSADLAKLLDKVKPGATGTGNGGGNGVVLPSAPGAGAAGSGYRG